jgi:thiol-disulfide isomerase/thioredoxin
MDYGIEGQVAPELEDFQWIDEKGEIRTSVKLDEFGEKFKVIYCFQSWCPGCHSRGLPALQKMVSALKGSEKVAFMAIQTVFEGFSANTYTKMVETQKQYELKIPFGHDDGSGSTRKISSTMQNYRTGGTPWFIFVDQKNRVVFNDFHLNAEKAIEFLKSVS